MASLNDIIIDFLASHPNSRAKEIADALHFDRRDINRALYNDLELSGVVIKTDNYKWDLSDAAKESRTKADIAPEPDNIKINDGYAKALNLIESGKNVFITGKAGTGKTTLLKKIRKDYEGIKVIITLAPTGIAAENAGGYTMHSFLKLPLSPYAPDYTKDDLYSLDDDNIEAVKNLDIIIIDEISMVRCDMLDATDNILRHYRNCDKPFGGIQVIMFGDLFQLMPVAKAEDWNLIKEFYETPYFFSSAVLSQSDYYMCELEKVYRQRDNDFIHTLNNIRVGDITLSDINLINTRYIPASKLKDSESAITLMTRNRNARKFNTIKLASIQGFEQHYEADSYNWHEKPPTDWHLSLKPGARVMFIKNNNQFNQYKNGTMGWVEYVYPDTVYVRKDKDNELIEVNKQRWDAFQYYFDKKTKTIKTKVVGSFIQIPLKLAWAITIHKSQGLTFDKIDIDAADSFTFGQIYVALSRCKTLDGIRLRERIPTHKVIADDKITKFLSCIDSTGCVKALPPFKNPDIINAPAAKFSISSKTYDMIINGSKKRLIKNISSNNDATQIFESINGWLLSNKMFEHLHTKWKYNDMNNGNCPFILRKIKLMTLYCDSYCKSITCTVDDNITIQTNSSKTRWQVSIPIGSILPKNY